MEFWIADTQHPVPQHKRKQIVSALESHEEFLKMKNVILSGRMRPMQSAIIKMGPADAKALNFKWPWRPAVETLRRLVKSMNLQSDWIIRKWESSEPGVWVIQATYEPPITKAQPHTETPAAGKRPLGRPRKTA